jgi:hypothetical protein
MRNSKSRAFKILRPKSCSDTQNGQRISFFQKEHIQQAAHSICSVDVASVLGT